jgi:ABC transport system ATP-binding/permease protein
MSEPILKALMQLFALIVDVHDDTVLTNPEENIVKSFLSRHLNTELITRYYRMFQEFLTLFNAESVEKDSIRDRKRVSLNAMKILSICEKINEELQQKQKIYVLVQLMDFISSGEKITENQLDFLQTVATAFNIGRDEYQNIKSFIFGASLEIPEKNEVLIIDNIREQEPDTVKHVRRDNLEGRIVFLHIASTNTYLMRYSGKGDLYLNGQNIIDIQTYVFEHGSTIRGAGIDPVYYTEVVSLISESTFDSKIVIEACDVNYKFRNSENGIHNLDFHEVSGKLVGILGGSGVGKSTTLSILSGTLKPQSGKVLINGYDLYDEIEKKKLNGVIGFVPQDDLLIEDLTVYQNLYYNAKMCLNNFTENEIVEIVNKTLSDLDLEETRDLKVGNPLKKIISGGQRKRVNIALELLREPTILYVDEPTSGLSSVDSETVMNLLKEQTYLGKLVIVNIHQPSSELYKMFDKIMIIDKGGYQIYYGNPTEAIVYFKTHSNSPNPDEDQCAKCGNINTDQILQIIEAKVVDERGKATQLRKVSPREWAEKYRENIAGNNKKINIERQKLPVNKYSIPGLLGQSKIFFLRDLLSKIANKQYLLISLLGPPLLALLLAYFTRYAEGSSYRFSDNDNIPPYLFMCVITSMFFGLMVSSEEIIKDRKILKRESFLNLSWFSYLNSKVVMMFLFSAIQTFFFALIGNFILGIKDMLLSYWLVLFATSCFANILGLNISSAFNSVITIYILIPFIIIPQLLFSGVLVKFEKLHVSDQAQEYVPVIGDLMTARWSFEALAVRQFKDNNYEKHFFASEMKESEYIRYGNLIDKLAEDLDQCKRNIGNADYREVINDNFKKLNFYINELARKLDITPGKWIAALNIVDFNPAVEKEAKAFLDLLKKKSGILQRKEMQAKNSDISSFVESIGIDKKIDLQNNYENNKLRSMVLGDDNLKRITLETSNKIIGKYQPGYMKATSRYGRAHFYAPVKMIGNMEFDTYWFNVTVVWIGSFLLYIILYYNLLRKLVDFLGRIRLREGKI